MTKKKIIIISLIVIVFLISIGANAYYLGWQKLKDKIKEDGFNIAISYIKNQIDSTGEVKINNELILIRKIEK